MFSDKRADSGRGFFLGAVGESVAKNDRFRDSGHSVMRVRSGRSRSLNDPVPRALNGPVVILAPDTEVDEQRYAPYMTRLEILRRDEFECQYCGTPVTIETANIDHISPWRKGGRTNSSNLASACRECNKRKGNGNLPMTKAADKRWRTGNR